MCLLFSAPIPSREERVRTWILQTVMRWALERRGRVVGSWILVSLLCVAALGTYGLVIDTSRQDMVSEDNEHSARFQSFKREFGTPLYLVVVLEGEDPASNRAYADALVDALHGRPDFVRRATARMDLRYFRENALLYASVGDLVELEGLMGGLAKSHEGPPESVTVAGLQGVLSRLFDVLEAVEENPAEFSGLESKGGEKPDVAGLVASIADIFGDLRDALSRDDWTELSPLLKADGDDAALMGTAGLDESGYFAAAGSELIFVFIQPSSNSEQITFVGPYVDVVEGIVDDLARPGVTTYVTGNQAYVAAEMRMLQRDVVFTTLLAVIGVALLFWFVYRSFSVSSLIFLPLLAGLLCALAFASVVIGRLNLLSSVFLAILVGLGVDFGIHLVARYREAIQEEQSLEKALESMLMGAGPGVITGALTTIAAFLGMAVTEFTAMQELAFISAFGLLSVLAAHLTLIPCMVTLLHERILREGARPRSSPWTGRRLASAIIGRPIWVFVLVAAVTLPLVSSIEPIRFSFDVTQFLPDDANVIRGYRRLEANDGFSPDFAVMVADSTKEAREFTEKLGAREDLVARVQSVATFLPDDSEKRAPVLGAIRTHLRALGSFSLDAEAPVDPGEIVSGLRALVDEEEMGPLVAGVPFVLRQHGREELVPVVDKIASEARALADFIESLPPDVARARLDNVESRLSALLKGVQVFVGAEHVRLGPADLPEAVRSDYWHRGEDGGDRLALHVFPRGSIADPEDMEKFNAFVTSVDPEVTGLPITFLEFGLMLREGLENSAFYAIGIIMFLLWIDFRSMPRVLLAMFPLLLGALWMVGCMNIFDIGYNFSNVMAIPLILGIGIDSGVHMVHRHAQGTQPAELAATTGKAIIISSLTTMVGFGSMIFGAYGGMQSLGITLLLGVGSCLVATVIVLPTTLAVGKLLRERL
jgi:predicted RND superfamily exporter protein